MNAARDAAFRNGQLARRGGGGVVPGAGFLQCPIIYIPLCGAASAAVRNAYEAFCYVANVQCTFVPRSTRFKARTHS